MKRSVEVLELSRHPEAQHLAVDGQPFVAILRDAWGQEIAAAGGSTGDEALAKLIEQESFELDVPIHRR